MELFIARVDSRDDIPCLGRRTSQDGQACPHNKYFHVNSAETVLYSYQICDRTYTWHYFVDLHSAILFHYLDSDVVNIAII